MLEDHAQRHQMNADRLRGATARRTGVLAGVCVDGEL
jgi:hypothetical protein